MSAKKICIIDDDRMYQMILQRHFLKVDPTIQLMSYLNGSEAIAGIQKTMAAGEPLCDTVLLDINMPIMDGWQFLAGIDAIVPDFGSRVNVYVLSSSLDDRDRSRALANKHVKDYIYKPITPEKIKELSGN